MGTNVSVFGNISETKKNEMIKDIDYMMEEKWPAHEIAEYVANKYAVAVSTVFANGKIVFNCRTGLASNFM